MSKRDKFIGYIFFLVLFSYNELFSKTNRLVSYQSIYEINLDNDREIKNTFGQPYVKSANGELLLDWFNDCNSWSSNQRMYISFVNSSGVGTVSDINYSLNEDHDSSRMNFALQVKQDNMIIEQFSGSAKKNDNVIIDLLTPQKKKLILPKDVFFPHEHLKLIIKKLGMEQKIFSERVYEGTIPNNFLNVSTFINEKSFMENKKLFPKEIDNKFWSIRMAYYKDKKQTPEMELTANINKQGVVSFFRYDYPEYSLNIKLKKVIINKDKCG